MLKTNKIKENREVKKENLPYSSQWLKSAKAFIFSPTFNVIALVLMFLSVFGGLRILRTRNTQAQVKFVSVRDKTT